MKRTIELLGSFGLAGVTLLILMLLTLFGTLEQRHSTLVDVQEKYFGSAFVVHEAGGWAPLAIGVTLILLAWGTTFWHALRTTEKRDFGSTVGTLLQVMFWPFGLRGRVPPQAFLPYGMLIALAIWPIASWAQGKPWPIPLPGAYLLLPLLLVNLLVGGLLRMRAGKSTVGVFIIHIGIVVLLGGSFIEDLYSDKGYLAVYEGESSDEFLSHHDWEVVVLEPSADGKTREFVVPQEAFDDLEENDVGRFVSAELPFDLELTGYLRNCKPKPARGGGAGVDGFHLEWLDPVDKRDEDLQRMNTPGLVAGIVPKATGTAQDALLWGRQKQPFVFTMEDVLTKKMRTFGIDLRKRRWKLPFSVRLDKFVYRAHPGTGMPKEFSSHVTKLDRGTARQVHITMNEPLRDEGFTLYQSGWGPQNVMPGTKTRFFSSFSVVTNPADWLLLGWPMPNWACLIIALGLLIHFLRKLLLHLKAEAKRRERQGSPA